MFEGIPPLKEFLSNSDEFHALVEGFLEPFTLWWYKPIPLDYYKRVIVNEHIYYRLGLVIGVALLIIIIGIGAYFVVGAID